MGNCSKSADDGLSVVSDLYWSRIHKRISLRFLGIILRVLRLEVSVNNVNINNQFQTTFAHVGGGGVKSLVEVTVNSNEDNVQEFDLYSLELLKLYIYVSIL